MKLTTPAQNAHLDPRLETNAKTLRSWLDGLPLLDPERTATEAGQHLHALNRQPLPPAERMELLAALADTYWRILDPVLAHPDIEGITVPEHATLLETLARYCRDLAFGYKIVLGESPDKPRLFGRNKQQHTAALLALQFLGQYLAHRYANYQRLPDSLWAEIDQIYRYARKQKFHTTVLPGQRGERTDIERAFVAIALLKISDPFRLTGGMLWEAQRMLHAQAGHAELGPWQDPPEQAGLIYLPAASPETEGFRHGLCLDIRQLVQTLQAAITGGHCGALGFSPALRDNEALHIVERLLHGWLKDVERKSERAEYLATADLAVGLERAFYFLNRGLAFDRYAYLSPEEHDEIDITSRTMDWNPGKQTEYHTLGCRTVNRSAGGVALRCNLPAEQAPRVGQIVTVRNQPHGAEQPGVWFVGATRWLSVENSTRFEFGVQYLARDAVPIAVRCVERTHGSRDFSAALRTDLHKDDRLWRIMITPTGLFAEGRYLEVVCGGKHERVRCLRRLERGRGFERFSYEPA